MSNTRKQNKSQLSAVVRHVFRFSAKDWQLSIALAALEGHDSMVISGTGSGKSLVFQMLCLLPEIQAYAAHPWLISLYWKHEKNIYSHSLECSVHCSDYFVNSTKHQLLMRP